MPSQCFFLVAWGGICMLGLVAWTTSVTDGQTHGQAVTPAPGEGTVLTMGLLVPHSGSRSLGNEVEITMQMAVNKVRRCLCCFLTLFRINIKGVVDS